MVSDVIMPPIGLFLGDVDFKELMWVLKPATDSAAEVAVRYGLFINTLIDFVIIALAIFMVIRGMNRLRKKQEEKPAEAPKPSEEVLLLREIRDSVKKK